MLVGLDLSAGMLGIAKQKAAARCGLCLCDAQEPAPPQEWRETCPGRYEDFIETPVYLIMKFVKTGTGR